MESIYFLKPYLPYLVLTFTVFVTYAYVVFKGGFVSDDLAGIADYDGKLQGLEYGMISRWLRYHLCGGNFPSKHKIKQPDGKELVLPQGKVPRRHHILILLVFTAACFLAYHALQNIIGSKLALLSLVLFIVHPVGVQAVAWCSALGYPLSFFWIACNLNLLQWFYAHQSTQNAIITTLLFCVFQFLGIHAQFIPMMQCVLLVFLGYYPFAILGAVISSVMMLDIIKQTIDLRKNEFKKQQMGGSTYLTPRKIIVAIKTLAYYFYLTLFPRNLGLYHKWGFHYGPDLERSDWRFWSGLAILAGLVCTFLYFPAVPVKLGILWFLSFSFIFLNWITIQQFVTERYVFIPTLGTCMVLSYFLQNYLVIYAFILGIYLMRTWAHLPTYQDELRFYQSNCWNFPTSEVSLGNLGVTQMRIGQLGSGLDSWTLATRLNPDYDVPWYNIFSSMKSNAMVSIQNGDYVGGLNQLSQAKFYLDKTLACKICHFPDQWKQEQTELQNTLNNPEKFLQGEFARLQMLGHKLSGMLAQAKNDEERKNINISITNNSAQISRLQSFMLSHKMPLVPKEQLPEFNTSFMLSKLFNP